jgi:hypothetical protein
MKKLGSKPHVLLAVGSLALALTSCRESDEQSRFIEPENVAGHLIERGFQPGEAPGTYTDPEGNPISEEEALERTGRSTIRRGFGRFRFGIGFGG